MLIYNFTRGRHSRSTVALNSSTHVHQMQQVEYIGIADGYYLFFIYGSIYIFFINKVFLSFDKKLLDL
jgi:hypothetical protein